MVWSARISPAFAVEHLRQLTGLPHADGFGETVSYPWTRDRPAPRIDTAVPGGGPAAHLLTVELDSFACALALVELGWRPAVLNMANEWNCGGAWERSRGSQEEALMRRSSLPLSLWPRRRSNDTRLAELDEAELPRAPPIYPWTEAQVVYTPTVLVCRDEAHAPLPDAQQRSVAVVSSAAQDLRLHKGPLRRFDPALTLEKLRGVLWAARAHGHDAIVLGAYGCGAFKNDPGAVVRCFEALLGPGGEFERSFGCVAFAVIYSERNLKAFAAAFPLAAQLPAKPAGDDDDVQGAAVGDAKASMVPAAVGESSGAAPSAGAPCRWLYSTDDDCAEGWMEYGPPMAAALDAAYLSDERRPVRLQRRTSTLGRTFEYEVDLATWTQRNVKTGTERAVKREPI